MKYFILILTVLFFTGLCVAAYYEGQPQQKDDSAIMGVIDNLLKDGGEQESQTSADGEPIKAEIINDTPEEFTIDVEFVDNMNANQDAEYFAVYVSDEKPENCADFKDVELSYEKPEEHLRRFDLSDHDDILQAIEEQKCVIIRNIPG